MGATRRLDPLTSRFGHDILCVFDTWQDTRDFLIDIIESSRGSAEVERLLRQSLVAGAEDWHYLIDCARSIQNRCGVDVTSLEGQDVLSYVWDIFEGRDASTASRPWEETDRLIAQAKNLERDPEIRPPSAGGLAVLKLSKPQQRSVKANGRVNTSHYWSNQPQDHDPRPAFKWSSQNQLLNSTFSAVTRSDPPASDPQINRHLNYVPDICHQFDLPTSQASPFSQDQHLDHALRNWNTFTKVVSPKKAKISPYFTPPTSEKKNSPKKRPPPGTVSTIPFAPLTSPTFGIIQEEFAHDPFWLLIAVTFLIKTNGNLAIPMFYKIKERFPTPQDIADPANGEEIVGMIRHLGLSVVRLAFMQKYARGFLETPPTAGLRYRVKNYDKRDIDPSMSTTSDDIETPETDPATSNGDNEDMDAWEIGHLTQGKYSIDSWRIFCRDELLGRAEDWNGKGREPEFQPEWMRVMPEDKELRAYLRWMWMREGWEWDPINGQRTVLRGELQRAVNEGRVEYDDTGGLRILDGPMS